MEFDVSLLIGCFTTEPIDQELEDATTNNEINLSEFFTNISCKNLDIINLYLEDAIRCEAKKSEHEEEFMQRAFDEVTDTCSDYIAYNGISGYVAKHILSYILDNKLVGFANNNNDDYCGGFFDVYDLISNLDIELEPVNFDTIYFGYITPNFTSNDVLIYDRTLYISKNFIREAIYGK